ncbi:hypothetical protein KQI41_18685 [Tissierella pigra]|uniref:hypothetical protein n=1 Tax=Tissierella pigra TaxID=2607614 RepID=UPI001C11691E|nr:hypothetical protein [Tissierella pigra]MBU5428420.1 hypothetical protein [Tissierella pigra]
MIDKAVTHFGITMTLRKRGYKLTRDNYAIISNKSTFGKNMIYKKALENNDEKLIKSYSEIYVDQEGLIYRDDWCERRLVEVIQNFDLNMNFFKRLDHVKFQDEIVKFLYQTKFFEIEDLREYSCPGYYVMILDKYCQLYIGTSKDIKKRIRQHWGGAKMGFDRLICGPITKSKLSIDSFRALDTTRILVYPTDDIYSKEDEFINCFSNEFVCNRIGGGIMEFGGLSVATNVKTRNLK